MRTRRVLSMGALVLAVLGVVFMGGWGMAAPVPDTGVTKCYDMDSEMLCPEEGEPFYGQDANYAINPPSYTKLDESGNALPDDAVSWAMVKDNVTGLIWEVKRNKDELQNYSDPRDADNTYTWYAPEDPYPGTPGDGTDTKDFIDALNAARFGGFDDWRLPTIQELAYLVRYDIPFPGPTIDSRYFPNTVAYYYCSSTTHAQYPGFAWLIHFGYGYDNTHDKSDSYSVRAVRGGQSGSLGDLVICPAEKEGDGRYRDNGDGTVTDTSTGLMWQQNTARDGQGEYDRMTWEEALAYCEGLDLGNHTDWRLPNIEELRSLVDYSRFDVAVDMVFFPNTTVCNYWASATYANHPGYAWSIYFDDGADDLDDKSGGDYVRAVRGGQSGSFRPLALFSAQPTSGTTPLEVAFTDASTGTITTWSWTFGDGGTSTAQNPTHTYTIPGTYTVTLTATGPGGSDTETKAAYITVNHPAPVAAFSGTPTTGVAPLIVAFTDASTGNATSWSWDFGDGGSDTAKNPWHTYNNEGTYTVTLVVTGPGGSDTETKVAYITVTASDCPAEQAVRAGGRSVDGERALSMLRGFRDEVLGGSPNGKAFIGMYARHREEVNGILVENPDISGRMAACAIRAANAVKVGSGGLTLPKALLTEFLDLLEDLERRGSDALAADLEAIDAFISGHAAKAAGNKVRIGIE